MKAEKLWDRYVEYTADLTEHARKLAFAAAAICWFFKTPEITFPPAVQLSLVFIVLFFIFDVLHYAGGAITLRMYLEREEQKHWAKTQKELTDVLKPKWVDTTATIFAAAKTLVLLIAFGCLITEFGYRIVQQREDKAAQKTQTTARTATPVP